MTPSWFRPFYMLDQDYFAFNLKYLYFVGLWPEDDLSKMQRFFYKIYENFMHFVTVIMLIITAIGVYKHKDDQTLLLASLDKNLVSYNFFFKIILFVINRKELRNLIEEIRESNDVLTEEKKKLMVDAVLFLTGFAVLITGSFSAFAIYEGEMTVEAWMPFDPLESRMKLITSAQLLAAVFLPGLFRAFAIEGIVCSVLMYICDQFIELQKTLRSLNYTEENNIEVRKKFKGVIKKHIRLMKYSHTMERIFREYFLVQHMAVTLELCLNAIMVTLVSDIKLLITFAGYLGIALINAYIYSYLGNELIIQSAGIAMAGYDGPWISWPLDMQKDLLTLITVAQRPLVLTFGGLGLLCIHTFSQALYNGYSIFAVLNDVVD